LYLRTHNGGCREETFCLGRSEIDHGAPVSSLVSARGGIGMTGGWVELGNHDYAVRIDADRTAAAALGMVQYKELGNAYFCRLSFSVQEIDETRHLSGNTGSLVLGFLMLISAYKPSRAQREQPPGNVTGTQHGHDCDSQTENIHRFSASNVRGPAAVREHLPPGASSK
jgi:hypothetical protein